MIVKAFEVRDKGTFIPVIAVKMIPTQQGGRFEQERYLLSRAGYGKDPRANPIVVVCRMEAAGVDRNATYDPYSWGNRTMQTAHLHIQKHFDDMFSGDVIDVQFILGEAQEPKLSERDQDQYHHPT
jgi:hypothetical protein